MKRIYFYEGLYEFFSKTIIDPDFNYKNFIHENLCQRSSFRIKHDLLWCKVCDQEFNELERYSYNKETANLLFCYKEDGIYLTKPADLILD